LARIDPTAISWRSTEPDPQNDGRYKQGSSRPTLAQRYDFDAFAITVLESPWPAQSPVSIGTNKCEDVDMH
jgi:hypothetical protein